MSDITEDQARKVAKLARLKLTDEQIHTYTAQLDAVLHYMDKIAQLDLDGVEPMAHPTDLTNKLREDTPTEPLPNDKVLANAPQSDPPYFRVPKVLGDGSSA
jgi:aspartyl-tRNA(Asn)/glutamyl-tRNA(Gln) amidotransferase subunit C